MLCFAHKIYYLLIPQQSQHSKLLSSCNQAKYCNTFYTFYSFEISTTIIYRFILCILHSGNTLFNLRKYF